MKKLRYLLGLSIIASALIIAPAAFAENGNSSNSNSGNGSSTPASPPTTSADDKGTDQPLTETEKTEMQGRVDKLKTELKVKLSDAESKKLKLKCQPAQTTIKTVQSRVQTNVPQRTKAYQELTDHLANIITKLQAKGVDVTELQQEQTALKGLLATYTTDAAALKQAISDARSVDCITDPAAFKAALQTAQTARDKVIKDITDIKTYVTGTIKPTLVKIRQALEAQEKSENNTSTQQEGSN